jgi:hypothetical protein
MVGVENQRIIAITECRTNGAHDMLSASGQRRYK